MVPLHVDIAASSCEAALKRLECTRRSQSPVSILHSGDASREGGHVRWIRRTLGRSVEVFVSAGPRSG